jgi:hypothetical protein
MQEAVPRAEGGPRRVSPKEEEALGRGTPQLWSGERSDPRPLPPAIRGEQTSAPLNAPARAQSTMKPPLLLSCLWQYRTQSGPHPLA